MALYNNSIFDQADFEHARSIVLTPENGVSTDVRWNYETNWLIEKVSRYVDLSNKMIVLDFGCGVGRLSKVLVERNCFVVGVDASRKMLNHANLYVDSDLFMPIASQALQCLSDNGLEVDIVLAVWVLQHIPELGTEIDRLYRVLKTGGYLVVADMNHRALPTNDGWVSDGIDCFGLLSERFELVDRCVFDPPFAPENLLANAYIAIFKKV